MGNRRGWFGYAPGPLGRTVAEHKHGVVSVTIMEDDLHGGLLMLLSVSNEERAEHSRHATLNEAMAHARAEYGVSQRDWVLT